MIVNDNLSNELNVLLWSNDGDKTLNKHLAKHLDDIAINKKQNELNRSIDRSEYLSELTGKEVEIKPRPTGYSSSRSKVELTKYLNAFWHESCYSHELLRNLFSRVSRCISQRGLSMPVEELVVIAEDIIPHIMSIPLEETYAYTSVDKRVIHNETMVEMYHTGEITKQECIDSFKGNTTYPVLETVDDFITILFKECYNYRFIFPKAVNKGVADAYSIGRQYREGIGYHTGLTDNILRWLNDGEILDHNVETLEPITVDDIKTELLLGNYQPLAINVIDYLIDRNADVNRCYLSVTDIKLFFNIGKWTALDIVADLRKCAKVVQSRR